MMHRKTRTLVSVLGIAIQVATVMILVGLVNGTLEGISARLESVGADVLFQPPDASLILGATHAVMPTTMADLMKQKVTAAGIDELKQALPQCRIEWDGGVIEPQ